MRRETEENEEGGVRNGNRQQGRSAMCGRTQYNAQKGTPSLDVRGDKHESRIEGDYGWAVQGEGFRGDLEDKDRAGNGPRRDYLPRL